MVEASFVNKYGELFKLTSKKPLVRERSYIIIKRNDEVVCFYDKTTDLYSFPSDQDVSLSALPSWEFSIVVGIMDENEPIKEMQNYRVYDVGSAQLEQTPLLWCKIRDILVRKIRLDATQKLGFKHLLVREKKK